MLSFKYLGILLTATDSNLQRLSGRNSQSLEGYKELVFTGTDIGEGRRGLYDFAAFFNHCCPRYSAVRIIDVGGEAPYQVSVGGVQT